MYYNCLDVVPMVPKNTVLYYLDVVPMVPEHTLLCTMTTKMLRKWSQITLVYLQRLPGCCASGPKEYVWSAQASAQLAPSTSARSQSVALATFLKSQLYSLFLQ